jgi:hypothetical protein
MVNRISALASLVVAVVALVIAGFAALRPSPVPLIDESDVAAIQQDGGKRSARWLS